MKNISLHKRHQFLRVFGYFPQFCDQTPNEKSLWGGEVSGSFFERSQSIKWVLAWLLVATTHMCRNPEAGIDREHGRYELKAISTVTHESGPSKKMILLTRTALTPVCWGINCPSVHLCLLGEAVRGVSTGSESEGTEGCTDCHGPTDKNLVGSGISCRTESFLFSFQTSHVCCSAHIGREANESKLREEREHRR